MLQANILLTSAIEGGSAPFDNGKLRVAFRHWPDRHPLPEGSVVYAFIDWALSDNSGLELCRRLRCDQLFAEAHVTMILDSDDTDARRRALRAGADDYVVGPVNRSLLLDRVIPVMLHNQDTGAHGCLTLGDLTVDLPAFQARWQGRSIQLMPNEFNLLRYLVEHSGRVHSRKHLIAALVKQEPPVEERTVDVWIGRLRRALRTAGAGDMLRTVRTMGYVLDTP